VFALNDTAQALRSDVPGSFRAAVRFSAGAIRWRCWADLLGTVREGGGGAERALGLSLFDFYAANKALDFSDAGRIVDVGGGTGELLAAILKANPDKHGVLFDLPHVVAHAPAVFEQHGLGKRAQCAGGSFFDTSPPAGDTYMLKSVIHDWDDARSGAILRNCRAGINVTGQLILLERELPEFGYATVPDPFLLDLEMLVMTPGGRERTRSEFARLLSASGFELVQVTPTASPLSAFHARPR
jgi:hypothetical protein